MFMFTELARRVERDGGVTKSEGVFRKKKTTRGDNKRGKIRKHKSQDKKIGRNAEKR